MKPTRWLEQEQARMRDRLARRKGMSDREKAAKYQQRLRAAREAYAAAKQAQRLAKRDVTVERMMRLAFRRAA